MRRLSLAALTLIALLSSGVPAHAWKVKTHLALAELAWDDAIEDGKVTIERIALADGGTWRRTKIGDYVVESRTLQALRDHRAFYQAGVCGPDAFPDILTGQRLIHEDDFDEIAKSVEIPWPMKSRKFLGIAGGSNRYLQDLWDAAERSPNNPKLRAFMIGYLTHAAGDLFAHTYVNRFAGGPFSLAEDNALKHVTLESYLEKFGPQPTSLSISITGIESAIYENLVAAHYYYKKDGNRWQTAPRFWDYNVPGEMFNATTSLPAQFARLRDRVYVDMQSRSRISPIRAYEERWIADIDAGLREWPRVSKKIADLVMVNPTPNDPQLATKVMDVLSTYKNQHSISMLGAPDAVGDIAGLLSVVTGFIDELPGLKQLGVLMKQARAVFVNRLFQEATGQSLDSWLDYMRRPEQKFDDALFIREGNGQGRRLTRTEFDQTEIRLVKGQWLWDELGPAYNAVVLSKLTLLSQSELKRLLRDMGAPSAEINNEVTAPNIMLGYIRSLDKSNQWQLKSQGGSVQHRDMPLYRLRGTEGRRIFDQLFYNPATSRGLIRTPAVKAAEDAPLRERETRLLGLAAGTTLRKAVLLPAGTHTLTLEVTPTRATQRTIALKAQLLRGTTVLEQLRFAETAARSQDTTTFTLSTPLEGWLELEQDPDGAPVNVVVRID